MSNTEETFDLIEQDEGEYVIRRVQADGQVQEMEVSEDDVLALARVALHLEARILERRSRPGVEAIAAMNVTSAGLATDLHKTAVHLSLFNELDIKVSFSLPLEVAKGLSEKLPQFVANIEASIPSRTTQ